MQAERSELQAILGALRTSGQVGELAFLRTPEAVFFARGEVRAHCPETPVTRLIQGVYGRDAKMARKILRNRIATSYRLTPACRGMIRVAAKSVAEEIPPERGAFLPAVALLELEPRQEHPQWNLPETRNQDWLGLVNRLAEELPRRSSLRYLSDRPVAAILVSGEQELLFGASNSNASDRTRHAEVNLVQGWWNKTGRALPRGATIYVSLKPCRMCAGMILHCCEDLTNFRVIYAEEDLGPMAQATALDGIPGIQEHR
ncbi:MAG: Bd3614 family nucleic acid deaminase [Bdellovibrionota bacterium]